MLAGAALAALALAPVRRRRTAEPRRSARTYVQARAAAMNGDHVRAAQLLANLAGSQPDQVDIAKKALAEAIGAGRMDLALSLARIDPGGQAADRCAPASRRRRGHAIAGAEQALPWLAVSADNGDLAFLAPLITAWDAAERGDAERAQPAIGRVPDESLLAPLRPRKQALLLLKFRRTADAEPFARRAIGSRRCTRRPGAAGACRWLPCRRRQGAGADHARRHGRTIAAARRGSRPASRAVKRSTRCAKALSEG